MRAALIFALLLAACGGAKELHLTFELDATVTAEQAAQIRALEIAVLGAEPSAVRYTIDKQLADRKVTWIYRSKVEAPLRFVVEARGDARKLIASGQSNVVTPSGSAVEETVRLGATPAVVSKRRLGQTCVAGVDVCASGFCVDGVCCASACEGACATCNGAIPGTCTNAAAGTNPRKACTADAANPCGLDGTCDGLGSCRIAPATRICAQQKCTNGMLSSASVCDGAGTCLAPTMRACDPWACDTAGVGCVTICTTTSGCKGGVTCTAGSCGKAGQGAKCVSPIECQGGLCVDGFCCESSCTGACKSCKEPGREGLCVDVTPGNLDPHGVCVDGGAAACGQDGRCAAGATCSLYAAGTLCAGGACSADGTEALGPSVCAGDGSACPPQEHKACGAYRCATDGAPGCDESCGECAFYESGAAPPFSQQCAAGRQCVDRCLGGDARFACE